MAEARLFLVLTIAAVICTGAISTQNIWPDAYTASGQIIMPYGDMVEPFKAYIDVAAGKGKIEFYEGMATIFYDVKKGDYGMTYKVVPETINSSYYNVMTCFALPGDKDTPVKIQQVVPDMSPYQFAVNTTYSGQPVSIYLSSFTEGHKNNNYTLIVSEDGDPVFLRFVGLDRLMGSHYDEYDIKYETFTSGSPDPSVFAVPNVEGCQGFPGPGIGSAMSQSPFFELFGAKGYRREHQNEQTEHHFQKFKKAHARNYKDEREESLRKTNFHHNFRYINSMNRRNVAYKLAVNHMTDYSDSELKSMRGYIGKALKTGTPYKPTDGPNPPNINWRLHGAVTPVKDQGICGSCWSFGTTGTIEGSQFLKYKRLVSLSEQSLVDCSWGYGNNGCDGGESERAYRWIVENGCIPEETAYGQYMMQDGRCHANISTCGAKISGFMNTKSGDEDQLMNAIANHGPISIAIDASLKTFSFYSYGVYYDDACGNTPDDLDHQVLAVGYGTLDDKDYWYVKNSWSTHWGMDGYILMSRKDNNCGVSTDASFAIIK